MKEHDILGISVFANEEHIEKAYADKLKKLTEYKSDSGYDELITKKISVLDEARRTCIRYYKSSFAKKTAQELIHEAKRISAPNTLNNLCPFGPIFIIGNLCCGAHEGYFELCSTCSGDDCCSGLEDDICNTVFGVGDTALWLIIGGAISAASGRAEVRQREMDEENEKQRQQNNLTKMRSARDSLNHLNSKTSALKQEMEIKKRNSDEVAAGYERRIKRIAAFAEEMKFGIAENSIRNTHLAAEMKKETQNALEDYRRAENAYRENLSMIEDAQSQLDEANAKI